MNDFKVRYLASYEGISHYSWGIPESMDAFPSIEAAVRSFRSRQSTGWDYSCIFRSNREQMWSYDGHESMHWPAVTDQDVMNLYPVVGRGRFNTLAIDDYSSIRLSVGPRGGIVREDY